MAKRFANYSIPIRNGYGIAEASPLVAVNAGTNAAEHVLPVGQINEKLRRKSVDVRIGESNESGEGEIVVKGKSVFMGYYKGEKEAERVLEMVGFTPEILVL